MYFVLSKIVSSPDVYEIPVEAVREAIVNAVMHRNYAVGASVLVTLFSDRLEVWNPISLPTSLEVDQLRQPHSSAPAGAGPTARPRTRSAADPETSPETGPAPDPAAGHTPAGSQVSPQVMALLRVLEKEAPLVTNEICKRLDMGRTNLRQRYLDPALAAGLIEPTLPETPNSRLQQYRLTAKGAGLLKS